MDSHFDNLKIEKSNAITRYRRIRTIAISLKVILFTVAVALFPCSPVTFIGNYLRRLSVCLLNPHVVFIIGNAIVIALFVLSRQFDVGENAGTVLHQEIVFASDGGPPPAMEERTDSQTKCEEFERGTEEAPEQIRRTETEEVKCEIPVESTVELQRSETKRRLMLFNSEIEKAKKLIKRFQRTQSEKLKREIAVKHRRELRLSETEKSLVLFNSDDGRKTMPVDSLSNDEFRLAVEAFIKKHQSFLKAQEIDGTYQ